MESILINPQTKSQSNVLTALLREMKIPFTAYPNDIEIEVSEAEMQAIDEGLEDLRTGNVIPNNEAQKIFYDAIYNVE